MALSCDWWKRKAEKKVEKTFDHYYMYYYYYFYYYYDYYLVRIVNKMRGQSVFVQSPNWNARAGVGALLNYLYLYKLYDRYSYMI